jgi:hypothetical protein
MSNEKPTPQTRVFGAAGESETDNLVALLLRKGFNVVLRDIRKDAQAFSEFLGRGFSKHPVIVHHDGQGLDRSKVEQMPDVVEPPAPPPAPAPEPQNQSVASASHEAEPAEPPPAASAPAPAAPAAPEPVEASPAREAAPAAEPPPVAGAAG